MLAAQRFLTAGFFELFHWATFNLAASRVRFFWSNQSPHVEKLTAKYGCKCCEHSMCEESCPFQDEKNGLAWGQGITHFGFGKLQWPLLLYHLYLTQSNHYMSK